ncbi:MAG TPA: hypothetical protein VII12_00465 [Thermoanaerobaculia bacterium]|jgi:hypothetical protein
MTVFEKGLITIGVYTSVFYLSPIAFLNTSVVALVVPAAIAGLATAHRVRFLTRSRR